MREKASTFESQAYQNSNSRVNYLKCVAGGLSNVERQVQDNAESEGLDNALGLTGLGMPGSQEPVEATAYQAMDATGSAPGSTYPNHQHSYQGQNTEVTSETPDITARMGLLHLDGEATARSAAAGRDTAAPVSQQASQSTPLAREQGSQSQLTAAQVVSATAADDEVWEKLEYVKE